MRVHSIETLGALDGPGLRTVLFLSGCPMRCKYCHNPDVVFGAGEERTEEELAALCARYKPYYGADGGVTLSGGEPLIQSESAIRLMRLLKEQNIGTCIDTGGSLFVPEALDAADIVLLDVKHTDPAAYKALTGVDADNMLKCLSHLKKTGKRFWVRQVIVPGVTDDAAQVRKLKVAAAGAEKIELLPYHTMGVEKWEKLGRDYALKGVLPPSAEKMAELNKIINGEER